MKIFKIGLSAFFGIFLASQAHAESLEQLLNSGPPTTSAPVPDPANISIMFGKDIKWSGEAGEHQAKLFGDMNKPGPYGILIKWDPGYNSKPHFHSTDRYAYVVSGTWWMSSSTNYDPDKMYPVPAGSFVTDLTNKVHWDGAKKSTGPCMLVLVGMGPMVTTHFTQKDPKNPEFTPPAK